MAGLDPDHTLERQQRGARQHSAAQLDWLLSAMSGRSRRTRRSRLSVLPKGRFPATSPTLWLARRGHERSQSGAPKSKVYTPVFEARPGRLAYHRGRTALGLAPNASLHIASTGRKISVKKPRKSCTAASRFESDRISALNGGESLLSQSSNAGCSNPSRTNGQTDRSAKRPTPWPSKTACNTSSRLAQVNQPLTTTS